MTAGLKKIQNHRYFTTWQTTKTAASNTFPQPLPVLMQAQLDSADHRLSQPVIQNRHFFKTVTTIRV